MRRRSKGPSIHGPYKHGDRWRVHVVTRRGGKRSTVYQSFATQTLAEAFIAGARDEAQGVTVSHAVTEFLEHKRSQGRASSSIAAYEDRLRAIVGRVMHRPVRYLAHRGAELYAAACRYAEEHRRIKERNGADAQRNALIAAGMLGKFCVKQKWLTVNPFAGVEPVGQRVHGSDKPQPTVDESRQIEAYCIANSHDQYAVMTLAYLYLGTRSSELTKRDVRDVDDDGRLLWIRHAKTRNGARRLVIPSPLAEMMSALCAGRAADAPLFTGDDSQRLTISHAYKRITRVCKAAGAIAGPQSLRRTNATLQVAANVSATAVAAHLGHGSVNIAQRSYVARGASEAAGNERALKVIQGGRR